MLPLLRLRARRANPPLAAHRPRARPAPGAPRPGCCPRRNPAGGCGQQGMTARSAMLFAAAALGEIAGVFLIWRTMREGASPWVAVAGALLVVAYGFLATLESDPHFGR